MSAARLQESPGPARFGPKALTAAAAVLYAGYLLQVVSPLRLNPDAIVYLSMAASAAEGQGFLHHGSPTHFPVGYPVILFALDRAGVASPAAIIGLNCLFLAAGLAAGYGVLRRGLALTKGEAAFVCCLTLLCSVFINNLFIPMSDAVFFGLSMTCVLLLLRAQRGRGLKRWLALSGAALLIAACVLVRTVGVSLLPALAWVCLSRGANVRAALSAALEKRARAAALALAACAALALAGLALTRTIYFRGALKIYSDGGAATAVTLLNYRAKDWGELVANLRIVDTPRPVRLGLKAAGLLGLAVSLYALWLRRRRLGVVEIYVCSFTLILLLWPYTDGRFWIPVVPLLMGLLVAPYRQAAARAPRLRFAAAAYLTWFVLAGLFALASNTRESLSNLRYEDLDAGTRSVVARFSK